MRKFARPLFVLALLCLGITGSRAQGTPTVFINEIHYDNTGTDAGEFIEIAGPAGTNLVGYSLVLYNGDGSRRRVQYPYNTVHGPVRVRFQTSRTGSARSRSRMPQDGIQNGTTDGVALVQGTTVIQFLSYEGMVTASNGPAAGMTEHGHRRERDRHRSNRRVTATRRYREPAIPISPGRHQPSHRPAPSIRARRSHGESAPDRQQHDAAGQRVERSGEFDDYDHLQRKRHRIGRRPSRSRAAASRRRSTRARHLRCCSP